MPREASLRRFKYIFCLTLLWLCLTQSLFGQTCPELFSTQSQLAEARQKKSQRALIEFLKSSEPSYSNVQDSIEFLNAHDLQRPENSAFALALAPELIRQAEQLIQTIPAHASQKQLQSISNKFRLLNVPSLRNLLSEIQQEQVGKIFWLFNRANWNVNLSTEARRIQITEGMREIQKLKASNLNQKLYLPHENYIRIIENDLQSSDAESLMTTVECNGFCGSQIHALIRDDVPNNFSQKILRDAEAVVVAKSQSKSSKNLILIADRQASPLRDLVFNGLMAAEKAGFQSVVLPAFRTGYAFGSVESNYQEISFEILLGISKYAEYGTGIVKDISVSVPKNSVLKSHFEEWLKKSRPSIDRSLRHNIREVTLSGQGFEIVPDEATSKILLPNSPIYRDLHLPWDLKRMMEVYAPIPLGPLVNKKLFSSKTPSVLNMPIKMPHSSVRVPIELQSITEFLQKIFDHEARINPKMDEFFVYLTVDQRPVAAGTTQRGAGVHIDGVQGARYPIKLPPEHSYSASDTLGTIFYPQVFDLRNVDPAVDNVHDKIYDQLDPSKRMITQDYEIYFWNSYSAHEAQVAEKEIQSRLFVRVEFSKKVYDSYGDTKSPLFDYNWQTVHRPIPPLKGQ